MSYINGEGYTDFTAGMAIRNVSREERKERRTVAKRRSCRRTDQEERNHNRAVSLRKMTDEQLCSYIDGAIRDTYEKGYAEGKKEGLSKKKNVDQFIATLEISKVPGIGKATINKLLKVAKENGYI